MGSSTSPKIDALELLELFDQVDAVVFSADAKTHAVRLLGPRSQSRLGHPCDVSIDADVFWGLIPADKRKDVFDLLRTVTADGISRSIEHPISIEGQGETWFRTTVKRSALPTGCTGSLLGVMIDITSARRVELQWLELESLLVALGETMPFDFWICEPDGCVLQNPVSRERHGNMVGRTRPDWDRCVERALSGEQLREEVELEVDGHPQHHVRVVAPVRAEDGIHAVLGVEIDITELKQTEERLRKSLAELSDAQDSLVRRKQLTAMGEMSALVAHEIRNPLGTISNALSLLRKRDRTGDPAAELCLIIEEEVTRLNRLVASLLDSVRPMSVDLTPMPLGEVVDDALAQSLRADGRADGIRIHRVVDPALPPIPMDAHLFGMALRNVFQNALQAMPFSGDLFLEIDREHDGASAWTRVSIRDSGPGLAQDVRDRIFEPFVTTRPTGSGLGLTIVRRVLEEHHGTVELSSEPGRGTTCVLRLPLATLE